jgi:hypothetical protein
MLQLRELMETMDRRLQLMEERQDFSDRLLQARELDEVTLTAIRAEGEDETG